MVDSFLSAAGDDATEALLDNTVFQSGVRADWDKRPALRGVPLDKRALLSGVVNCGALAGIAANQAARAVAAQSVPLQAGWWWASYLPDCAAHVLKEWNARIGGYVPVAPDGSPRSFCAWFWAVPVAAARRAINRECDLYWRRSLNVDLDGAGRGGDGVCFCLSGLGSVSPLDDAMTDAMDTVAAGDKETAWLLALRLGEAPAEMAAKCLGKSAVTVHRQYAKLDERIVGGLEAAARLLGLPTPNIT
jgi:hypothetical protein